LFRKSTYSNPSGNCVEAGDFRTSSHGGARVRVRDTKDAGTGPVLSFTPAAWAAFTGGLK
jgi:hypothetical protein